VLNLGLCICFLQILEHLPFTAGSCYRVQLLYLRLLLMFVNVTFIRQGFSLWLFFPILKTLLIEHLAPIHLSISFVFSFMSCCFLALNSLEADSGMLWKIRLVCHFSFSRCSLTIVLAIWLWLNWQVGFVISTRGLTFTQPVIQSCYHRFVYFSNSWFREPLIWLSSLVIVLVYFYQSYLINS